MSEQQSTTFENKCAILSELWMGYRGEKKFQDFVDYNDIGLPLAFLIDEELVRAEPQAKVMVDETFELLIAAVGVEDTGFDSLDELLLG